MKKLYSTPEFKVICLNTEDIMSASSTLEEDDIGAEIFDALSI